MKFFESEPGLIRLRDEPGFKKSEKNLLNLVNVKSPPESGGVSATADGVITFARVCTPLPRLLGLSHKRTGEQKMKKLKKLVNPCENLAFPKPGTTVVLPLNSITTVIRAVIDTGVFSLVLSLDEQRKNIGE